MKFYYKKGDQFRVYDCNTKEFETINRLPYDCKTFYVFSDYGSDEGILQFINDFKQWNNELKEVTKIDYLKYNSHQGAIPLIVKKLCKHFDKFDDTDVVEALWIEKCNNAGLQILKQEGKQECYGYDFKAFYLSIMGKKELNYDIPLKRGKEIILSELNFYKLDVGMYRVKITSDDNKFIFGYSKHDIYTNISIYYAFKCQRNGLNIKIELIQDGKPNAYIYGKTTKEGVHSSRYMFGNMYDVLMEVKTKYPKNKLVKFICSSIWGHIVKFNTKNMSMDEIIKEDIYCSTEITNNKADYWIRDCTGTYYELVSMKNPYKFNVGRIKPFLLSMGRVISANVASLYIDDLVRVQTDGFVFTKPHDDIISKFKTYPTLLNDDKTTGLIDWKHVNGYYNYTTKEQHGRIKLNNE